MMVWIGLGLLAVVLICYAMWVLMLATSFMARTEREGRLPPMARAIYWPAFWLCMALHFLTNVVLLTPLFGELPRELTAFQRLRRHALGCGLQGKFARMLLRNLVDPFV